MERIFHFTTCNVKGNLGPSEEEAKNYYENTNVKVDIIKGIQKWKVPYSGRYIIEASGASGLASCVKYKSGKGVIVSIKVDLNKNDILYLLVGQQGIIPNDYWGGPGGGASFVAKEDRNSPYILKPAETNVSLILAAAGGGGSGDCEIDITPKDGGDGLCDIATSGDGGNNQATAPSGGSGFEYDAKNDVTKSFLNGGEADYYYTQRAGKGYGAFGGGGHPNDAGGGGGGYKGGDSFEEGQRGTGGYSFYHQEQLIECVSGQHDGSGFINIYFIKMRYITCDIKKSLRLSSFLFNIFFIFK